MSVTATKKALYRFFSGFGLPVYPEDSVPERDPNTGAKVVPPYITVQLIAPDWRQSVPFYGRLWYRGDSYAAIDAKADEIAAAIAEGVSVPAEGGAVYIYRARNFCQHMPTPGNTTLKCAYLNMTLMSHTN